MGARPLEPRAYFQGVLRRPASLRATGTSLRHHRTSLVGYDESDVRPAVLVAGELSANAILHARTDFEVRLLLRHTCLRIEVFDLDPRLPVAAFVPDDAARGRGLFLVQTVASCWGVETQGEGRVVWAELPPGKRLAIGASSGRFETERDGSNGDEPRRYGAGRASPRPASGRERYRSHRRYRATP